MIKLLLIIFLSVSQCTYRCNTRWEECKINQIYFVPSNGWNNAGYYFRVTFKNGNGRSFWINNDYINISEGNYNEPIAKIPFDCNGNIIHWIKAQYYFKLPIGYKIEMKK